MTRVWARSLGSEESGLFSSQPRLLELWDSWQERQSVDISQGSQEGILLMGRVGSVIWPFGVWVKQDSPWLKWRTDEPDTSNRGIVVRLGVSWWLSGKNPPALQVGKIHWAACSHFPVHCTTQENPQTEGLMEKQVHVMAKSQTQLENWASNNSNHGSG